VSRRRRDDADTFDDAGTRGPEIGVGRLMGKAHLILGLAATSIGLSLALLPAPASWILTAGIALGVVALFTWSIAQANSGFWIETLWRAPEASRAVALTFDDGPDVCFTSRILDILAEKRVTATFFVVGERAARHPEVVRRAHDLGHAIGNHSHTHSLGFHFHHERGMRSEIDSCNRVIRSVIGHTPRLFRAPQGLKTPALGDVLREHGMAAVGWQVRGMDYWLQDPERIARRIVERAIGGGVLQMHDGGGFLGGADRSATLRALPIVIDGLRARGFTFVRVDELFHVPAYEADGVAAGRPHQDSESWLSSNGNGDGGAS
jgi:peptidoglycan-N-acetylglucosamine deacetylase